MKLFLNGSKFYQGNHHNWYFLHWLILQYDKMIFLNITKQRGQHDCMKQQASGNIREGSSCCTASWIPVCHCIGWGINFPFAWFCFTAFDCYLPPDPGPCKAYMPRFYYNIHSRSCEQFIYGGCAGNSNNFHYLGECLHVCQSHFFLMFKEFH